MRIRLATSADIPALGRLGALLVRTHQNFDAKRFLTASDQTERRYGEFLGTQIDDPDAIVLVAELNGAVVGYAYAGVEGIDYMALRGPAGALHDIVVDAAHQKQGIGRALLDATLAALRERGVPRVVLMTAATNENAKTLFARSGFRATMIEMTREFDDSREP
ncbi:MAG TPA: GNAT family N-acetyltransferase [Gemmatimonadaceae bacterium]|nr:GNAT family N-acetyltransferase [Gemmatimonadaceae bacterium]